MMSTFLSHDCWVFYGPTLIFADITKNQKTTVPFNFFCQRDLLLKVSSWCHLWNRRYNVFYIFSCKFIITDPQQNTRLKVLGHHLFNLKTILILANKTLKNQKIPINFKENGGTPSKYNWSISIVLCCIFEIM